MSSLVVFFELQEVRLDVVLGLGNMKVLVLAEDGIIEGDVEVFTLLRRYLFVLIIYVVCIR